MERQTRCAAAAFGPSNAIRRSRATAANALGFRAVATRIHARCPSATTAAATTSAAVSPFHASARGDDDVVGPRRVGQHLVRVLVSPFRVGLLHPEIFGD